MIEKPDEDRLLIWWDAKRSVQRLSKVPGNPSALEFSLVIPRDVPGSGALGATRAKRSEVEPSSSDKSQIGKNSPSKH